MSGKRWKPVKKNKLLFSDAETHEKKLNHLTSKYRNQQPPTHQQHNTQTKLFANLRIRLSVKQNTKKLSTKTWLLFPKHKPLLSLRLLSIT